jgi:predicted CXXCH cytochrome family protein
MVSPRPGSRARHSLRSVGPLLILLLGISVVAACDSIGSRQGYDPPQPIAFSHALHAGDRQIACLYCHFGAERSRHAGVPPVNVCMNCHSQVDKDNPEIQKLYAAVATSQPIQWVQVDQLPDYVYFTHAAHVQAGIDCQRCHGPVQTMERVSQVETMSMGFCLDCHRQMAATASTTGLSPPTDCSACHH